MPDVGPEQMQHEASATGSDSEWEYEYHETETQDYYFTIDLSAAVAQKLGSQSQSQPKPRLRRRKRGTTSDNGHRNTDSNGNPIEHAERTQDDQDQDQGQGQGQGQEREQGQEQEPEQETVPESHSNSQQEPEPIPASVDPDAKAAQPACIQILDLQGPNPLISYDGHLYSCHWASAIGTDLFFAKPSQPPATSGTGTGAGRLRGSSSNDAPTPPDSGFLGMSSARLIAKKAQLFRRSPSPVSARRTREEQQQQRQVEGTATTWTATAENSNPELNMSVPADASEAVKKRARFLERLAAAKRKRDQMDAENASGREDDQHVRRTPSPEQTPQPIDEDADDVSQAPDLSRVLRYDPGAEASSAKAGNNRRVRPRRTVEDPGVDPARSTDTRPVTSVALPILTQAATEGPCQSGQNGSIREENGPEQVERNSVDENG